MTTTKELLPLVYDALKDLSLYKNEKYGNSALVPVGCFSKLTAIEGIKIRLDDKIKRVMTGEEIRKNDVADIIGYCALLCAANGWTNFDEFKD